MDNNELLMIVLAFVVGYMVSGMMKQMCGGRLVEGKKPSCNELPSLIHTPGISFNNLTTENRSNIANIHDYLSQGKRCR